MRSWVARQDNIPRGRTIPMGAVPVEARGLRHMAPTYLRRRPGSPSNGRLGSALYALTPFRIGRPALTSTNADPKAVLRRDALVRRGESRARRPRRFQPSPRRGGFAPRTPLAPPHCLGLSSAARRARHAPAFDGARRGRDSRPPCRSSLAGDRRSLFASGGRATRLARARCRFASPSRTRPSSIRISCSCRLPASTGAATASATAPAITTGPWPILRAMKPVHAVGVAYGVCEIAAVPYETHDQSLDAVVTEQETILFSEQ